MVDYADFDMIKSKLILIDTIWYKGFRIEIIETIEDGKASFKIGLEGIVRGIAVPENIFNKTEAILWFHDNCLFFPDFKIPSQF